MFKGFHLIKRHFNGSYPINKGFLRVPIKRLLKVFHPFRKQFFLDRKKKAKEGAGRDNAQSFHRLREIAPIS